MLAAASLRIDLERQRRAVLELPDVGHGRGGDVGERLRGQEGRVRRHEHVGVTASSQHAYHTLGIRTRGQPSEGRAECKQCKRFLVPRSTPHPHSVGQQLPLELLEVPVPGCVSLPRRHRREVGEEQRACTRPMPQLNRRREKVQDAQQLFAITRLISCTLHLPQLPLLAAPHLTNSNACNTQLLLLIPTAL